MIDGVLSEAVQEALSLALPGVYVGEPQDDQPIPSQAVLMELQSDIVVGSPLQRGTLTLNVATGNAVAGAHALTFGGATSPWPIRSPPTRLPRTALAPS